MIFLVAVDVAHRIISLMAGPFPLQFDSWEYWMLGRQVAAGDFLMLEEGKAFRTPVFPYFLGVIQYVMGEWALLGTIVVQHILGVASTLLLGHACFLLTRSTAATCVSMVISMACVSRVQFANHILSETLFIFLLALHLLFVIRWIMGNRARDALIAGLTLGLAILTRPVAQFLWIAELMILLLPFSWARGFDPVLRLKPAALFLLAMAIVVAPWLARNGAVFDDPFLSKSLGRNIWIACYSPTGAQLPLPEQFVQSDEAYGDFRETWNTYGYLRNQGMSELEAEDWMLATCLESIRQHKLTFSRSVAENFVHYWWTIKGMVPWYHRYQEDKNYGDQETWYLPGSIGWFDQIFGFFYRYHVAWSAMFSLLTLAGTGLLIRTRDSRTAGLVLLGMLGYFALVTSVVEEPIYRYRMVVEPLMILGLVAGFWKLLGRETGVTQQPR